MRGGGGSCGLLAGGKTYQYRQTDSCSSKNTKVLEKDTEEDDI